MTKVTAKIIFAVLLAIIIIAPATSFAASTQSWFSRFSLASILDVFFPKTDIAEETGALINFDPERAREQNNLEELRKGISNPLKPSPAGLRVNVPSSFKGNVRVEGPISIGGNAAVGGTLTASNAVISKSLTAPNIIYEIRAGDGLIISDDKQRPIISSIFWKIATTSPTSGTTIAIKEPFSSLMIPESVSANHVSTKSLDVSELTIKNRLVVGEELDVAGKVIFRGEFMETTATTTFSFEKPMLFLISTSTGKLFQINTSTSSANALFSVQASGGGKINIGGSLNVSKLLTAEGPLTVSGALTAQGIANFEKDLVIPSLKGCDGFSVLETDADGKIVCGKDDKGLSSGGTISNGSANRLAFYSDSSTIESSSFLFSQGGSLGVGSSTPLGLFSVEQNGGNIGIAVGSSTRTNFIVDSYGNVGIATSTPTPISTDRTGGLLAVGGTGTSTFIGGVSTGGISSSRGLSITGGSILLTSSATSTFNNGIVISEGCFRLPNGSCAGVVGSGGGVNVGTANRLAYYSAAAVIDSIDFLTVNSANSFLGIATATPAQMFSVHGGALISGTTTVQGLIATSSIEVRGSATSTFTNSGISVAGGGLSSASGLTITGGNIFQSNLNATNTLRGIDVLTGGLRVSTVQSCSGANALTTDSSGNVICSTSTQNLSGWTDDGDVVRLTTASDYVAVGTTTVPVASQFTIAATTTTSNLLTLMTLQNQSASPFLVQRERQGAGATTTLFSVDQSGGLLATASSTFSNGLIVASNAPLQASSTLLAQNIIANASSTFANRLNVAGLLQLGTGINSSSTATSTFAGGISVTGAGGLSTDSGLTVTGGNILHTGANFVVQSSGNVGIGTTSPVSKLSVVGESAFAGGGVFGLAYAGTAAPANGLIIQGNVGIGTTSPSYKLSVSGSQSGAANNVTTGSIFSAVAPNSGVHIRLRDGTVGISGSGFETQLFTDAGSGNFEIYNAAPTTYGLVFGTAATERMRITNAGNVGIGTTSPQTKLEVVNTSSGATADQLYLSNLASATSTASRLSFRANDVTNATTTGAVTAILNRNFNTASSSLTFSTLQSGLLTEAVRIDGSGNVGIGTASPGAKLAVSGSIFLGNIEGELGHSIRWRGRSDLGIAEDNYSLVMSAPEGIRINLDSDGGGTGTNFEIAKDVSTKTGGTVLFIVTEGTGNVGIGTTTPAQLLSVQGGALISGTTTVQGLIATSSLIVQGTATSTFAGGISVSTSGGLSSASGLTITGGSILQTNNATSTLRGLDVLAGGLRVSTVQSCSGANSLTTDSSGNVICSASTQNLSGWTDDGDVVRLTTASDYVAVGTTTVPAASQFTIAATTTTSNLLTLMTLQNQSASPLLIQRERQGTGATTTLFSVDQSGGLVASASSTFSSGLIAAGSPLQASSTLLAQNIIANASSTFANRLNVAGLLQAGGAINSSSTATSTFSNGIKLYTGCFETATGACLGSGAAGGGITTLNGLDQVSQTFSVTNTSNDWNVLSISSSGSTHTFTTSASTSPAFGFMVATSTLSLNDFYGRANFRNGATTTNFAATASSTFSSGVNISGLLQAGGGFNSSSTATSTFAGGISVSSAGGLSSASGLTITGGSILQTNNATSTLRGLDVLAGGLRVSTVQSCSGANSLTTDSSGNIICSASTQNLSGWTDDGSIVRLTSVTDNVGIGTSTPDVRSVLTIGATSTTANLLTLKMVQNQTGNPFTITDHASSTLSFFNPSGYLAIGTTTLASGFGNALAVQGNAFISGTTTVQGLIATNTLMVGGTTGSRLIVTADGNVGIGTTNPAAKLHIAQDAGDNVVIRDASSGASGSQAYTLYRKARTGLANPTAVSAGDILGSVSFQGYNDAYRDAAEIRVLVDTGVGATGADMPGVLSFRTTPDGSATTQERMRIDGSGNLGIGTTTPAQLLSVQGGAIISGTTTVQGLIATSSLIVQGTATSTFTNSGISVAGGGFSSASGLTITGGNILQTNNATSTIRGLDVLAGGLRVSTIQSCSGANSLTTDSSGNVICSASTQNLSGWTDDGSIVRLTSVTDNVGIGTSTPDVRSVLTIGATSTTANLLTLKLAENQTGNPLAVTNSASSTLSFFNPSGYLAIGTTTLASGFGNALAVQGNAFISGTTTVGGLIATNTLMVGGTTGSRLIVTADGNVGIGTTTTAQLLSVQGGALISGTTTVQGLIATSSIIIQGTATSTFAGGVQVNGGGFRIGTILSCTGSGTLETDGSGNIYCGTDDNSGGAAAGWTDTGTRVELTTQTDFVGVGTTSADARSVLTVGATSTTANLLSLKVLTGQTGDAFNITRVSQEATSTMFAINLGTAGFINSYFQTRSTTTIPTNSIYAWSIATSSTSTPLLTFNTETNRRATTSINSGLTIDGGAVEYDSSSGIISVDSMNTGPMAFDNDAGILSWIDMPISTTTGGIEMSYSAMLDGNSILTIYGTTTPGSGEISRRGSVGIGTTTPLWLLNIVGSATTSIPRRTAQKTFFGLTDPLAGGNLKHWTLSSQGGNFYISTTTDDGATSTSPAISILSNGRVGIGTSTPASRLSIEGTCVDTGAGCATTDIAELYPASEDMEAGDIVAVDQNEKFNVKKASRSDEAVIGIVSTSPAMIIEGSSLQFMSDVYNATPQKPAVALVGRVPTKVSLENGPIKIGDRISPSSVPGVGMKAASSTATVGVALEQFDGNSAEVDHLAGGSTSKILVFVNLGWSHLDQQIFSFASSTDIVGGLDMSSGRIKANYILDMDDHDIVNARSILSAGGAWSIDENGKLTVNEIHAKKLCLEDVCVTKEELKMLLEKAGTASVLPSAPPPADLSAEAMAEEDVEEEGDSPVNSNESNGAEPIQMPQPDESAPIENASSTPDEGLPTPSVGDGDPAPAPPPADLSAEVPAQAGSPPTEPTLEPTPDGPPAGEAGST